MESDRFIINIEVKSSRKRGVPSLEIAEDLGLKTYNITASQLPSIIVKLLKVGRPFYLPAVEESKWIKGTEATSSWGLGIR